MPKDKSESHKHLIPAARSVFLEKGFQNASIRDIASRAGMTSGALYRHFKDKEDMFSALVESAVQKADEWLKRHITRGYESVSSEQYDMLWKDSEIDLMREVLYPNLDAFRLVLCSSQGTRYEHFLDDMIEKQVAIMSDVLAKLRSQGIPTKELSCEELHIFMSAYINALLVPVIRNYPLEKALHYLKTVETFFLPGWHDILGC